MESSRHNDDRITSSMNSSHYHYYLLIEQLTNLALVHDDLHPMYQIPSINGISKNELVLSLLHFDTHGNKVDFLLPKPVFLKVRNLLGKQVVEENRQ